MDVPFENTRSKGKITKTDFSKYGSQSNDFIVDDSNNYKGLKYYMDLADKQNENSEQETEDDPEIMDNFTTSETKYMKNLSSDQYEKYFKQLTNMFNSSDKKPFKFKILDSFSLDEETKKFIIDKIDRFNCMEENDNEYHKLDDWITQLKNIPFDSYTIPDKIKDNTSKILACKNYLDQAVYGQQEAKSQIIQVFAQNLTNPHGNGKVIALQGPMGNGKTTLIKDGLSKALNKPFYFIGLGGATNASFLNGHSYTWEGSKPGIIVQALQKNKVMDGILYFDELDKISKTDSGNEISNCLCHITDSSQNTEYQDKYLSNINLDLSKHMFVFSFNDSKEINPILLDRLLVIKTKGYNVKQKIKIAQDYLLPKICKNAGFSLDDIIFTTNILEYIINYYTKEDGVRSLKRNLENIISYFNLVKQLPVEENLGGLLKIKKNITYPINLDSSMVDILLGEKTINCDINSLYI